ncbi:hypothetical protein KPL76_08940 [Subtercola sp. PAMC28395]|uniref:hypothetical protein n=1 Tax=Subtercola sp. PAMC28395 TaxID=2846775 RepID=UPI001C0D17D8|nr:hypothetical protein [Subtercola sp. PAMC28395]QWT22914.1 hypothetical protein KPL76_08940 [Subtercola sp. PAMC28395]
MPITSTPTPMLRSSPVLRQVRPTLWRVIRADGSLAGYIARAGDAEGARTVGVATAPRFEARRLVVSTRQIMQIGDFASINDALTCFL